MKKIMLFLLFSFIMVAENRPEKLMFAHEDKNAYPWVFYDEGTKTCVGLDIILFEILGKELDIEIEYEKFPWSRCLMEMKTGEVDGVFASSYKKYRLEYGLYPKKDGSLDEDRRLHESGYSLYVLKDSKIDYIDGEMVNVDKAVGVQRGFSIKDDLEKLGLLVDDGTADPVAQMRKLIYGRVSAVALQSERAEKILLNKDFKNKIKKLKIDEKCFKEKAYFLMLSKKFVKMYPEFSKQIWDTVKEIRESKEFRIKKSKFYKKY